MKLQSAFLTTWAKFPNAHPLSRVITLSEAMRVLVGKFYALRPYQHPHSINKNCLDFRKRINDMHLGTDTAFEQLAMIADKIDDTPNFKNDSDGLKQQAEHLRLELRSAMSDGRTEDVIAIQTRLNDLPLRIQTAEVREAR